MKQILIFLFLFACLIFIKLSPVFAIVNPLSFPNNHFGIHIIDENDLDQAAALINSSSGEWGYVVFVISEKERDQGKWQTIFNRMRRLKLIPIVRLATQSEDDKWKKPNNTDAATWADFLNKLNWVVKNRYVILFNEPNHAKEWGGEINPEDYGEIVEVFSRELKKKSDNFFILPAGLDASSANTKESMEISLFLDRLLKSQPEFFNYIDGWSSHSYPNPNFSASPSKSGKGSIRSYLWEINYLRKLGLNKNLPLFITETGWAHQEGEKNDYSFLPSTQTAQNFEFAYQNIWQDSSLVLVSPFLLNYQGEPFDHFSWKKINSNAFYPQFETVKKLPKKKGEPLQEHKSSFIKTDIPDKLVSFSDYEFEVEVSNNGQSIWDRNDGFRLSLTSEPPFENIFIDELAKIEPFQANKVKIKLKTPRKEGLNNISLQMQKDEQFFGDLWESEINIVAPPKIAIKSKFWFGKDKNMQNAILLIYDQGNLLKKFENIAIINNEGLISEVRDIIPNKNYRFVLLSPYYLPAQTHSPLWEGKTVIEFKRLLPFDTDNNGKLSLSDFFEGLKNPRRTFALLWPF